MSETELAEQGKNDSKDAPAEGCSRADWFGLRSEDPATRTVAYIRFSVSLTILTLLGLLLLFMVTIPAVAQESVDHSTITILQASIIHPNDAGFRSSIRQKMKGQSEGSLTMRKLKLAWRGGREMIILNDANSLDLSDDTVTYTSKAEVYDAQELSDFNVFALQTDEFSWSIKGEALVRTGGGLRVPVDIDKKVTVAGFQGFPVDPVVTQVNITGGSPKILYNYLKATMTSVADVRIVFGQDALFSASSNGLLLGTGTLKDFVLDTGSFGIEAFVEMHPAPGEAYEELMRVMTNFISGIDSPIVMSDMRLAKPVGWLTTGLASVTLNSLLPGLSDKLITQVDMWPPPSPSATVPLHRLFGRVPFYLDIFNPIDTEVSVTSILANVYSYDLRLPVEERVPVLIAFVNQSVAFTAPPRVATTSPLMTAVLNLPKGTASPAAPVIFALTYAHEGHIDIEITAFVGKIGEYPVRTVYSQTQVFCTLTTWDVDVQGPVPGSTAVPSTAPTLVPTAAPTVDPSAMPTAAPTTATPTVGPTATPTVAPTATPTEIGTEELPR